MNTDITALKVSTPGRICLFGEHQDYLNLPVIACAISLRIEVSGSKRKDLLITISLPDIKREESFLLNSNLEYLRERDYFKSSINVLKKHGFNFSKGFECTVHGDIPINAGTSSSSALIISWLNFLTQMSDEPKNLPPEILAHYGYEAEVLEFNEPGGMMDHYSTAFGGIVYLSFKPVINLEKIPSELGAFILGNSLEPKDTKYILRKVKNQVISIIEDLSARYSEFELSCISQKELSKYGKTLSTNQLQLLTATIKNKEITEEAKKVLLEFPLNQKKFGALLSEQQVILRDILNISTPKINKLIEASLIAGAYGAKINGSGGGGCMFAYAPQNPEVVKESIEKEGGKAYIIYPDNGTEVFARSRG